MFVLIFLQHPFDPFKVVAGLKLSLLIFILQMTVYDKCSTHCLEHLQLGGLCKVKNLKHSTSCCYCQPYILSQWQNITSCMFHLHNSVIVRLLKLTQYTISFFFFSIIQLEIFALKWQCLFISCILILFMKVHANL